MATLSSDKKYVTVTKGDTLSQIAQTYGSYIAGSGIYGTGGKLATLVSVNDISDPNRIVVGQKIYFASSSTSKKTNTSSTPVIKAFGLQSNTDRTIYATWTWSKTNTENYRVIWQYDTGDGVWFVGADSTVTDKQSLYNGPQNAKRVRFKVLPVSKKRKVNNKETSYWTASWSTIQTYSFSANPPVTPSNLGVSIDKQTLTATLTNVDTSVDGINATHVQFRIYRVVNSKNKLYKTSTSVKIENKYVQYTCKLENGYHYLIECRSVRGSLYSDWSDMIDAGYTAPAAPAKITKCTLTNEGRIDVSWTSVSTATGYKVEYTTNTEYFDKSPADVKSQTVTTNNTFVTLTDDEKGEEWFFRVQATRGELSSEWSPIQSIIYGDTPAAPTTWSSSDTAMAADNGVIELHWIHNTTDDSTPTKAKVEMIMTRDGETRKGVHTVDYTTGDANTKESLEPDESDGGSSGVGGVIKNFFEWVTGTDAFHISNDDTDTDDNKQTSDYYVIPTANLGGGTILKWRVQTAGVTGQYGDWSVLREVTIYDEPTLGLNVLDYEDGLLETMNQFPIKIKALAGQDDTQAPIGYHVSIISNGEYDTVDGLGVTTQVNPGDEIYSKYFDITGELEIQLSPSDVDLENNIEYEIICTVAMDSGLSAETRHPFTVAWTDEQYEPNAEIGLDPESVTTTIRPYCENAEGELIQGVVLSVYRREFDGTFVKLETDIDNTGYTYITDPHPSLDMARYRIVATSEATGAVSFYDIPGYPVGEKAIILQWDEDWTNFDVSRDENGDIVSEDALDQRTWSGSLLRLPYNVDVSDTGKIDVEHVEYIGRRYPVSYYGTQVGGTATWSTAIDKEDKETLYALRRLAIWTGDVYVREPSGSGYWASVSVSFNQTHCETTIPVTLNITRVEGGA